MNITSKALAWVCVAFLGLSPVPALLVWPYATSADYNGILAAVFAANAGTALFVRLVFGLPQLSSHTSRAPRFFVGVIGVIYALMSATFWIADEVDNLWLLAGIISPIVVTLFVLTWFVDKVNEEGEKHDGE